MANVYKVVLFMLVSLAAFAQGSRFDNFSWTTAPVANQTAIVPVPGSTIAICNYPANATPCTNYANIYSDQTLTTLINQAVTPVTADSQGNWGFWAYSKAYQYTICTPSPTSCSGPYNAFLPLGYDSTTGLPEINTFSLAATGTFTNTDCHYGFLSNIGGGMACSIFHSSQGSGNYSSDSVTGVITVPLGSTAYQADAVTGLAVNNDGVTNTVALYGYAQCNVANGKCWGANPAVQAAAGAINTNIQGMEVDVNIQTGATGATARGINVSMPIAHATPALSQGVSVNAGNSDGVLWDYGFATQRAAATTGLFLDSLASTASTASQPIVLRGHDGGNVAQDVSIQASNVGNLNLTPASGQNVVVTAGSLGFGTSNVPFVSPDGSGGLRLIPITGQNTTFKNGTGGSVVATVDSNGKGTFNGGIQAGSSGSTMLDMYSATASLDFAAWAGSDCQDLTLTVTGAADGDDVSLGVPNSLASTAGVQFTGFVSAANTVTIRGCKVTVGASADPAATTVRATVRHF